MGEALAADADAGWAARLYAHVVQYTGRDVVLSDLERDFGFEWKHVFVQGRWEDPYFSRAVEHELATSLGVLLKGLNAVCRALPGLDPAELTSDADAHTDCVCNVIYNRLHKLLFSRDASQEQLLAAAAAARNDVLREAVTRAHQRISLQAGGLRALQRLCAAVHEGRGGVGMVDKEREAISYVVSMPPPSLMSELQIANVPLAELRAYLFPVEPERMCGTILEMSVCRWCATYYNQVSTACINTLNELRDVGQMACGWEGYAGIAMWHADRNRLQIATGVATGGLGAAAAFPDVPHTHAFEGQVLVATRTSQRTALRATRLALVVYEIVKMGLLRHRTVRANVILAYVNRFECEASIDRERMIANVDMDVDDHDVSSATLALAVPPVPSVVSAQSVSSGSLVLTLQQAAQVPKSLQRDYMILAVVRDLLQYQTFTVIRGPETDDETHSAPTEERAYLGITATCDRISNLPSVGDPVTPMVAGFTKASLTMAIGHVMHEKIGKGIVQWTATQDGIDCSDGDVEYTNVPTWVAGTKGLSFTKTGRHALMSYTSFVVQQMQAPTGPVFANTWHTSRSAKSHARRKQVPAGAVGN
jgi:hypothetical protein